MYICPVSISLSSGSLSPLTSLSISLILSLYHLLLCLESLSLSHTSLSLYLSLYLSLSHTSLSVSASLCLSLSVSASLCLSLSVSASLCLSLSLSRVSLQPLCLTSLSGSVYLSLSHQPLRLSISLSLLLVYFSELRGSLFSLTSLYIKPLYPHW